MIRQIGFCLYTCNDSRCGGFLTTGLKARPKHLGTSRKWTHHGQHRGRKEYIGLPSGVPRRRVAVNLVDIRSARSARELPENAVVYSWSAAALLHPLISMRNGCCVSGQASRVCGQARVLLPASNAALNSRERSVDDRASVPSASGNHPDLIRVAWKYAVAAFCPGSRNPGKPHSHDVRIAALTPQG